MNIPLHRLAALVYNTPLLITPAKAEVISGVLQAHIEARMSGMPIERKESAANEARPSAFIGETLANESGNGRTPYRVKDGKAIITIDGELVNRGEWVGADSGLVSYDGIRHQLAMATKDSRVKSIILDINSPGGTTIAAPPRSTLRTSTAMPAMVPRSPIFSIRGFYAIALVLAMGCATPRAAYVSTFADLATTRIAINGGAVEANPIFHGRTYPVIAATELLLTYAIVRYSEHTASKWPLRIWSTIHFSAATWNASQIVSH